MSNVAATIPSDWLMTGSCQSAWLARAHTPSNTTVPMVASRVRRVEAYTALKKQLVKNNPIPAAKGSAAEAARPSASASGTSLQAGNRRPRRYSPVRTAINTATPTNPAACSGTPFPGWNTMAGTHVSATTKANAQ